MYIVYINGKKFAGEQDRSLFPGVGRVAGECPEHPCNDGLIRRVSVLNDVSLLFSVMIRRWRSCLSWRASRR